MIPLANLSPMCNHLQIDEEETNGRSSSHFGVACQLITETPRSRRQQQEPMGMLLFTSQSQPSKKNRAKPNNIVFYSYFCSYFVGPDLSDSMITCDMGRRIRASLTRAFRKRWSTKLLTRPSSHISV